MQHKQGENRDQMFMFSLESAIAADSFVRVVDAFVEAIDLKSFGFAHVVCLEEGRPPYHPSALLKLFLYGYHYGIRTTRRLEREAQTNMECMWLLKGLRPKYKTIADFRKNHSKAFREVFRRFVCLLKEWNLIEGYTVVIDSFKIRGSNSLKNNFNESKLKRHLDYILQVLFSIKNLTFIFVPGAITCIQTEPGTSIATTGNPAKEHIVFNAITLRLVNPAQAGIYAHKAKPTVGISTVVSMLRLLKPMP